VGAVIKKIVKWGLILGITCGILGGASVAGIFYYYGRDLPAIMTRDDYNPREMSRVYSDDGELIAEWFKPGGRRTVVPLEEIPEEVEYAFMAAEDAQFMEHEGIDYYGMLRAFYYAIIHGDRIKGTSTITQQVVKNLILVPERTIERKVKEIILARELERNLSKRDILFMYLNTIYLGHGNYGVEEASRHYFGKSVDKLNLNQAAVLAGLPPAPASLSPKRDLEAARGRRDYVLEQLWEKGFIEEARYREVKARSIETVPVEESFPHLGMGQYFVERVRKKLFDRYGEQKVMTGGLRVRTTLDVDKQLEAAKSSRSGLHTYDDRRDYYDPVRSIDENDIEGFVAEKAKELSTTGLTGGEIYEAVVTKVDDEAEDIAVKLGRIEGDLVVEPRQRILRDADKLSERFARGDILEVVPLKTEPGNDGTVPVRFREGPQNAFVSIDHETRDVVALMGGYDFDHHMFNHATQATRQTGSTFKPFVYGAGLEQKIITPATIYLDSPAVFQMPGGKKWSPKNSDESWRGPVRVREGLGASRNVVAVRVLKEVGLETAKSFARRLGVESKLVDNYTMVMGSSELTPLELVNAYATIASGGMYAEPRFIKRVESTRGETDTFEVEKKRVLAEDVAYLLTSLMTSVVEGYVDRTGQQRGGTAHSLSELTQTVAGKTGTTNDTRDAWFVGFTPQLTTGAWVGFDDNRSLGPKEYGGRVAGPIWLQYMQQVLGDKKPHAFEPPESGITEARIDPETGKLARGDNGFVEEFLVGTAPTEYTPSEEEGSGENFLMNQFESSDGGDEKNKQAAPTN
jgi:penicillin-binding protein 1A